MRYVELEKLRLGNMESEGKITVQVDSIVAIESTPGTGDQMTTITLSGGRAVHVAGSYDQLRDATMVRVPA